MWRLSLWDASVFLLGATAASLALLGWHLVKPENPPCPSAACASLLVHFAASVLLGFRDASSRLGNI